MVDEIPGHGRDKIRSQKFLNALKGKPKYR
jgi:hypothetical protein